MDAVNGAANAPESNKVILGLLPDLGVDPEVIKEIEAELGSEPTSFNRHFDDNARGTLS